MILCSAAILLTPAMIPQSGLELVGRIQSSETEERLGDTFTDLGDVNGDGTADFAVGCPSYLTGSWGAGAGRVVVLSGADHSVLFEATGSAGDTLFGKCLATVGDVDQDGVLDFAAGASGTNLVTLLSGVDGTPLGTLPNPGVGGFGMTMTSTPDLSGDGMPDLVVGLPAETVNGVSFAGRLLVVDGVQCTLLRESWGSGTFHELGKAVCSPGDLDGDGLADLVVNGIAGNQYPSRGVTALSGSNLQPLHSVTAQELGQNQHDLDALGDVDGDGFGDYLVTGYRNNASETWMQGVSSIRSGADGSLIGTVVGGAFEDFGRQATRLGDIDGDGTDDFAILSLMLNRMWQLRPEVHVFSGADLSEITALISPTFNFFTVRVFPMQDLDSDGRDELVLGIPENQISWMSPPRYAPGGELHIWSYRM